MDAYNSDILETFLKAPGTMEEIAHSYMYLHSTVVKVSVYVYFWNLFWRWSTYCHDAVSSGTAHSVLKCNKSNYDWLQLTNTRALAYPRKHLL